MKPDTMRTIDRLAGIPLTFLATLLLRLAKAMGRGRGWSPRPARILFIELSEMGSTILADPAMRKARDRFGADLFFVIFRGNAESLQLLGTVPAANVFVIDPAGILTLCRDVVRFSIWARRMRIDTAIDLELFSRFSALLSLLSGAGLRAGFHRFYGEGLYRGDLLTHRVAYNPHQHIAKNFLALVNALLAPQREIPYSKTVIDDAELTLPQVQRSGAELDGVREVIRSLHPGWDPFGDRLVLINPNSSEMLPHRRWPADRFVQLMRLLLENYPDVLLVITGAPGEEADSRRIAAEIPGERCVDLTGRLDIAQLPALYLLASLLVTNDSGPAHFAAVTPLPTVVLFGPETPALYGSLGNARFVRANLACSPCVSAFNHRRSACDDNVCMQAITPEMVMREVREVLDNHP
ncbi:MAG: glycosyltransferase family 9 protein [Thermodesulfobacteriota bacterium]